MISLAAHGKFLSICRKYSAVINKEVPIEGIGALRLGLRY